MSDGYSRSPKLLKGAIVQFKTMPLVPIPNIIVFQYNPESFTRTITPYNPAPPDMAKAPPDSTTPVSSMAQPQEPTETFSVTLLLDASDDLETPDSHPIELVSGVAGRLAALEMLLYPTGDSLLGSLVGSVSVSLGSGGLTASLSKASFVARPEVPVTLFVWGPGRIVPVRLQSFSVEEQQWNQLLYPTRAKVTVGMKVVSKDALNADTTTTSDGKAIASFCYDWTRGQKEALAVASVSDVEAILGLLPF